MYNWFFVYMFIILYKLKSSVHFFNLQTKNQQKLKINVEFILFVNSLKRSF